MTTKSRLRSFLSNGRNLKVGWLITAGVVALYIGAIQPREYTAGINNSRASGLAAAQRGPVRLWHQMRFLPDLDAHLYQASMADAGGQVMAYMTATPGASREEDKDRKIVRTSSIEMVVQKPAESAEKIRKLAEELGGFLVSSQMSGGQDADRGSLTIRVPAARFEEARVQIHKLGLRVESESVDAQDVTRQYVDQAANLRNLQAEEMQYLSILKQSRTVKDTLDVTEKLSGVRGKIEQQRAEFEALSKQIETVSIAVSLRAEAEAEVFGLNWRPLYQIKIAFRDGLEALGSYALAMTGFVFLLPAIALWMITLVIGAAIGWKLLRFVGRKAFGIGMGAAAPQA